MNSFHRRRVLPAAVAAAVAAGTLLPAAEAFAQAAATRSRARAADAGQAVTLNFVNADIDGVARAMAAILRQQFIVDPRIKGTMTLYSETPLSPREAYTQFLAALRGLGFTVVEVGGVYKIVPEADAKLQTGTVTVGERTLRGGDQVLTQVFRLQNESANNLVAVLRPLISPNNTINANPGNNTLVITDYADNLQRLGKIIAAMDTPSAGDVEVIPIKYAVASDIATMVQRMTDSGGGTGGAAQAAAGGVPGGSTTAATVQVDARSNTLLVKAPNPARMASIRALIDKLDRPVTTAGASGNVWVVYLKNADAVKLATVLRAAYGGSAGGGGSGGSGGGGTPFSTASNTGATGGSANATNASSTGQTSPLSASAGPSTGGFVQADPSTNSLIITAPEPLYRQLRAVIEQLDSRRAQVYIESLIVEVDPELTSNLGVQLQFLGNTANSNIPGVGTNFSTYGTPINSVNSTTALGALAALSAGGNIGLVKNFGGAFGISAIINAFSRQSGTNILSTPNLVTLDNEEARIVVGQNVPFVTGSYTNTGTATTSPFQTIERKDVGTTLKIKPQIGENGTVRMTIYQESSSIAAVATGTTNTGPTTNKRSIESTVVVDDGQIIVLGGLIEDNYSSTRDKVPVLGDLPIVGGLFRNESRTRRRSNLMVFLRPVVMRDQTSSNRVSLDRYDYIRGQQLIEQPPQSAVLGINESPVLPQIRPGDTGPTGVPKLLSDTSSVVPVVPSIPASGAVPSFGAVPYTPARNPVPPLSPVAPTDVPRN